MIEKISKNLINNKITINVLAGTLRREFFYDEEKEKFVFKTNKRALKGEANKDLLLFLKKEYGLRFILVKGHKSREKVLEIIN